VPAAVSMVRAPLEPTAPSSYRLGASALSADRHPHRVSDRGQTALGAAVFRRSAESVTPLLDRAADPHAGQRSAAEIARFFELDEMTALLARAHPSRP
jgi:hypothetical protein